MKSLQTNIATANTLLIVVFAFVLEIRSHLWAQEIDCALKSRKVWCDSIGQPINAHGGCILYQDGLYYWYGESKKGPTYLPKANQKWGGTRVLADGIACYSSSNLCNWKYEGIALAADLRNPDSDLACENIIERPKVIYNERTGRVVMWFHQDSPDYKAARSGVAISDKPTGPFKYLGSFRPDAGIWPIDVTPSDKQPGTNNILARDFSGGQMARDMTLFVDDDKRAYQFYASENNATMHVSLLSEDYLRSAGIYARIFVGQFMEAPAVFKRNDKYYLIASGCTGWDPNPAHSAVATNIFGPWTELGNPCRGVNAGTTFNCQSTFVFPVTRRPDFFVIMFDRWDKWNLPESSYVWLPLDFDVEGRPIVRWQERSNSGPGANANVLRNLHPD